MIIDVENHLSLRERVESGKSESGKLCERYWTNDGNLTIRLFEDASRAEKTIQFMDDAGIDVAVLSTNALNTLEEFNVEIDEGVFDTNPPEGYTELTLSDILQVIPTEAKAGLAGLGIIPAGFIVWRRRRKKTTTDPN